MKRPVWKVATIVFPKANESASTWVLCWLDVFVYGSLLIGVARTVPAEPLATTSRPTAAMTAATALHTPHGPRSPKVVPIVVPGLEFA